MARFLGWAWAPVLASFFWIADILGLLIWWLVEGHPRYRTSDASVVYISDVGANHYALFVTGGVLTAFFYPLTVFAERYLRHIDRLPTTKRRRERTAGYLTIIFAIIGSIGLILLVTFDVYDFSTIHWISTVIFIVGVAISAVAQAAEIFSLKKALPEVKYLRKSAIWKVTIIILALICVILFAVLSYECDNNDDYGPVTGKAITDRRCYNVQSAAGAFEWAIAALFAIYLLTFIIDLLPYIKTSTKTPMATMKDHRGEEPLTPGTQHKRPSFNPTQSKST